MRALLLFCIISTSFLSYSQKVKQIEILNADYMEFDKNIGSGAVKYVGEVSFRQEKVIMYCDSAYFYPDENIVFAYENVHIVQADTLQLYGDLMKYNGDQELAEMRHNVILIDKETTLYTEYLDFDLANNIGYYIKGGHIISGDNTLDSEAGYYYSESKILYFRDSVVIVNPDYNIYADTLKYNTVSEVAFFLGPTEIVGEENYIYCENGWYDTRLNISQFNKNAFLESEGQTIQGDSLYYERDNGFGQVFDNVELFDSARQIILRGKYAIYYEDPQYAMMTDSAEFLQISEGDTLFVHADTLKSTVDTAGFKILRAYYKVKIFRTDIQGKCDSLSFLEHDSVFQLFYEPVLWSSEQQLTAELIEIHMANEKVDYLDMTKSAFIISQEDSIRFNQIKGRNMKGYFKDNELHTIEVKGNGQSLYFARDRDNLIGVNKAESTDILIYLKDDDIDRINMLVKPAAILNPPDALIGNDLYLGGFIWLDKHRPLKKEDIFIWISD